MDSFCFALCFQFRFTPSGPELEGGGVQRIRVEVRQHTLLHEIFSCMKCLYLLRDGENLRMLHRDPSLIIRWGLSIMEGSKGFGPPLGGSK